MKDKKQFTRPLTHHSETYTHHSPVITQNQLAPAFPPQTHQNRRQSREGKARSRSSSNKRRAKSPMFAKAHQTCQGQTYLPPTSTRNSRRVSGPRPTKTVTCMEIKPKSMEEKGGVSVQFSLKVGSNASTSDNDSSLTFIIKEFEEDNLGGFISPQMSRISENSEQRKTDFVRKNDSLIRMIS